MLAEADIAKSATCAKYLVGWMRVDKHARDAAGRTALGACREGTADPVVAKVLVSVGLEPEP